MIVNQNEQVITHMTKMQQLDQRSFDSELASARGVQHTNHHNNKTMFASHRLKTKPPIKQANRVFKTSRKISFQDALNTEGRR